MARGSSVVELLSRNTEANKAAMVWHIWQCEKKHRIFTGLLHTQRPVPNNQWTMLDDMQGKHTI
jgi:hypothetical protein